MRTVDLFMSIRKDTKSVPGGLLEYAPQEGKKEYQARTHKGEEPQPPQRASEPAPEKRPPVREGARNQRPEERAVSAKWSAVHGFEYPRL